MIDYGRMALTRMAFTAIDRTPVTRDAIAAEAGNRLAKRRARLSGVGIRTIDDKTL